MASNSGMSISIYLITVYGFFYGMGVFPWVLGFWLVTQLSSYHVIKRVEKITKKDGGFISKNGTLHEFLGYLFNSNKIRVLASLLTIGTYVGLLTTEFVLGYEILRALIPSNLSILGFNAEPLIFLFILIGAIFFYTSRSGFRVVIATDKIQLALIIIMMLSILGFIGTYYQPLANAYTDHFVPLFTLDSVFNPSGEGTLSFMFFFVFMNVIFWVAWWPSAMDQWHRVAATRNVEKALDKKFGTLSIASVAYLALLTFTFLAVGSMVKILINSTEGATQPIYLFLNEVVVNIGVIGVDPLFGWFFIGLIALGSASIIISTIDTFLIISTQSIVSDILLARKFKKKLFDLNQKIPIEAQKTILGDVRKVIFILIIPISVLFFVVYNLADVFTAVYFAFTFQMVLIAPLVIGLIKKDNSNNSRAIYWSMVCGGIWVIISNIYLVGTINHLLVSGSFDDLFIYYNILYANPPLTSAITFLIYLFIPKMKPKPEKKFQYSHERA